MALGFVREVWSGRTGSIDTGYRRDYVRNFEVQYTTTLESSLVVLTTPGIPRRGELYTPAIAAGEFDIAARCVKVSATQRDDDWRYWDVRAEYTNQWGRDVADLINNPDSLENPLLRPAKISFGFSDYDLPVFRDYRGVAAVSSARERFDTPLTAEAGRLTLSYERNEAAYNVAFADLYNKAVNSDVFLGLLPGRAKVHNLSASQEYEGPYAYWTVRKEIHFRKETFNDYVLDWGSRYYSGGYDPTARPVPFPDGRGNWLASGGLLNGKGDQLSASSATLTSAMDATTTQAVFAGASFPAVDLDLREWTIRIDDEVMLVVSDEDTHFEVVRGYAGTTPATHAAATAVYLDLVMLVFQLHRRLPFNVLDILV